MAVPKEERVVEIIVNGTKANASLKEMGAAAAVLSNQVAKIAADDPKRAELIAQLQTMRQRIGDARAEIAGLLTTEQQAAAAEQQLAASIAATAAEQQRASEEQQRAIVIGKSSTASLNEQRTAAGLLEKQLHAMSADDPGRAALIADYQALQARMGEARAEMSRVVKTEEQLRAEQDALRASQVQLVVNGQRVSASMREMREAAGQLENELEELGQEDPARGPLIAALQELRARIRAVNEEVVGVSETTSRMRQVMTNAFAFAVGGGIEQGIEKVVEMGKSIFTTTAKFETYGVVLENALGSKSLSQKALADIQQMAAKTPFAVDELTSSFLKFVNRGLQPSMAEMSKFGDLASSQGKSFDQLTEAVLDAGTGEFERLKEFGIGASKSGDQVTLSFKGVNQTVANTPEAIKGAILAMGEMKGVAGGMAAIAEGLDGQLSNLGDTADQTAIEWGQNLRPVFVAVLSTLGFLLALLKGLPGFIKENRGALLALAGAVMVFNVPLIQSNYELVKNAALSRGKVVWDNAVAISTRIWTVAQQGLNLALMANPIGAVIALVVLLVGAIVAAYDKSERFRAAVQSLWRAVEPLVAQFKGLYDQLRPVVSQLQEMWASLGAGQAFMEVFGYLLSVVVVVPLKLFISQVQLGIDVLTGLWDVGKRVANFFGADFKVDPKGSFDAFVQHLKSGSKSIVATLLGQDEALAESAKNQGSLFDKYAHAYQQRLDAALKARLAAEASTQLEALKLAEAALRQKLAKAKEGSEAEMRLKQQLVTNEAAQQLANEKKTAGDRAIIEAEAEQKRVKLAQEFYEKQAKEQKAAREKAAAEALKARLAEIEAERTHKEMLAQVKQASVAGRGDEQVTELSKIYTEGQLKIAALEANAQKEIAQLTGSAEQKRRRTLAIEQKLAAEVALVRDEVFKKQQDQVEKNDQETYKQWKEEVDRKLADIEEAGVREQAAFEAPFHASLALQQQYDELRYQARQAMFEKELTLIEAMLGRESAEYKKVAAAMEKDQRDHNKRRVANQEQTEKAKRDLARLEMRTAGDVLSFGLELLGQDEEARKKHHSLYTALAAAKIIIDGTKEVQQIWEYSAENPANGPTMGAAGIAMGTIQTALAIGRTALALSKIGGGGGSSDGGGSYWSGGATGTGAGLAVSPMGQLMAMSGMSVGANGRLLDGSGFAVAGIVHEDEYVIPKWQLADPQVAAVAQWLEARRLRGFADGGGTSAGMVQLPVPAASPTTGDEKLYAVLTQLLLVNQQQAAQLADVKQWQRELNVRLDLRAAQAGLDEYKQVQAASAIRIK